jgi:hypothetical protein
MPKFSRKQGLVAKLETTYGVDAAPTGAANAILVSNMRLRPLTQQLQERDISRPWLGHSASIQVASWKTLEFDVEVAGAGAAGTAPKYGPLLLGCGFVQTLNAGVSAVYTLKSDTFDSLTLWTEYDQVLHKMIGARGTVMCMLDARSVPKFRFAMTGLFVPVEDGTLTGVSYTGWVKPLAVNNDNTTVSLHGYAAVVDKLTVDLKNDTPYRNMVGTESVEITNRLPEGSITFENTSLADKNWWTSIAANTAGVLEVQHGSAAGNIVEFEAPSAVIQEPDFEDVDGIQMLAARLKLEPTEGGGGNDELVITVR